MKELIETRVENEIVKLLIEGRQLKEFYIRRLFSKEDYLGIIRMVMNHKKGRKVYRTKDALVSKIIDDVIQTNNAECIYEFALNEESYVDKLSDAILKTGDFHFINLFASHVENLPIEKFFDKVVERENPYLIANVIRNIADNNTEEKIGKERSQWIEKLIDEMIKLKDKEALIYPASYESENIPINKIIDAVIKIGSAADIDELSMYNNVSLEKLAEGLIYKKDEKYAYKFALEHPNIKTNELAQIVIDSGNAEYIYKFAKKVKDAPIKELTEAILKTKNSNYICLFARFVNNNIEDINRLANRVINLGNTKSVLDFAITVKGAPVDEMADIVIQSGDLYKIREFAMQVENAPIDKLADAIIKSKNIEMIYYFAKLVKNAPVDKMIEAIKRLI